MNTKKMMLGLAVFGLMSLNGMAQSQKTLSEAKATQAVKEEAAPALKVNTPQEMAQPQEAPRAQTPEVAPALELQAVPVQGGISTDKQAEIPALKAKSNSPAKAKSSTAVEAESAPATKNKK